MQKVLDSGTHESMMGTRCNKHMTQHKDTQDDILGTRAQRGAYTH